MTGRFLLLSVGLTTFHEITDTLRQQHLVLPGGRAMFQEFRVTLLPHVRVEQRVRSVGQTTLYFIRRQSAALNDALWSSV